MEKLRFPTACPHSALSRPQPHRFCNNDSSERQRLQPAPGLLRHPRKSGYGTLRPIAVGIPRPIARNNTCRLHGVEPYTYLVDVLQRISEHPAKRVRELTPRMWKSLFAHDPLPSALGHHNHDPPSH